MKTIPTYRKQPNADTAYVRLTDVKTGKRRQYALGEYNTPASREAYHRLIAQWEADGRRLPIVDRSTDDGPGLTIEDLCLQYWMGVKSEKSQPEMHKIRSMIRLICQYHGSTQIENFGPRALSDLIHPMSMGDLSATPARRPWTRTHLNQQTGRLKRMFRWGVAREIVPANVYHALTAVENVRTGTQGIKEGRKITTVDLDRVERTKPFLNRQIQALIELQIHTGARAGELLAMRPCDLDRSGDVWIYSLATHKMARFGKSKTIHLGPKSQRVIIPFLKRKSDACIFSPAEAEVERRGKRSTRSNAPGDRYIIQSYGKAIVRACARAFPFPLCMDLKHRQDWERANRWTPHQLRHTAATRIRAQYGLEAAQLMLGHSSAMITDAVYAERDQSKILAIAREVG